MPSATTVQPKNPTIDQLIERHKGKPGALLGLLETVQDLEKFRYLPEETLKKISEGMGIPLAQIYSVATFYSFFNLEPQGLHSVVVCRGTACHTRGSLELLNAALKRMGIEGFREDEANSATTADHFCSIRTVACFGQCALAPVVQVDGVIYSRVSLGRLVTILEKLRKGGDK